MGFLRIGPALIAAALGLAGGDACARPAGPARFDLAAARRTGDLAPWLGPVTAAAGAGLREPERTLRSTEWRGDGRSRPMRIHGVLVTPEGAGPAHRRTAVIVTHGLGAQAEVTSAREIARNLDVVALAVWAPGVGPSEGRGVTFDDPSA